MILFGDDDKIEKWRYKITKVEIIIPDEQIVTVPPERLVKLKLLEYYETHMFPLFYIQVSLEDYYYYLILKNKEKVKFHLIIRKYPIWMNKLDKASMTESDYESKTKGVQTNWINNYYYIITDDSVDDMRRAQKEKEFLKNYEKKTSDTDPAAAEHTLDKEDNVFEFYLFDRKKINGTKKIVNEVFTNVTITDVYTWLFKKAGFKAKSVLMAPADNKKVYKELLLPKMSIMAAFKFLDTYYGIYNSGSYIYIGLKKAYVLPYSGKCNAYQKNEIKHTGIIIPENLNTKHSSTCGTLKKKVSEVKSRYIVADCTTFKAVNMSTSNDYLNSNDLELVDSYSGETKKSTSNAKEEVKGKNDKNKKKKKKKTTYSMGKRNESLLTKKEEEERKNFVKYLENPTENEFYGTMYVARSDSMRIVMNISTRDYDISGIHLNKQFNIYFEDDGYYEKYKGSYAILSVSHEFTKFGEEDFQINSDIVLARTTENYGEMYNIFGKIKIKKKGSSVYKSNAKYVKPISISSLYSDRQKDSEIAVINEKVKSVTDYTDWWNNLINETQNALTNMDATNDYKNYLRVFEKNKLNISSASILTLGIVEEVTIEPLYTTFLNAAILGAESLWEIYKVEIPSVLDQTVHDAKVYYDQNKDIFTILKSSYIKYINNIDFLSLIHTLEEKVDEEG